MGTVGTEEKKQLCYDLGADNVCNYKEEDFEQVVKEAFGEVDVILDPVGASHFGKNINCIARDGRWVLYGLMGGSKVEQLNLGQLLQKRVTLTATTLRTRDPSYKAALVQSFIASNAVEKFLSGTFRPIIHSVLDWTQAAEGHALMESNINSGKIILKIT